MQTYISTQLTRFVETERGEYWTSPFPVEAYMSCHDCSIIWLPRMCWYGAPPWRHVRFHSYFRHQKSWQTTRKLIKRDYFIVSQTNPHIIPFLQGSTKLKRFHSHPERATKGAGVARASTLRHTAVNLVVNEITHQMQMMSDLAIFPPLCAKVRPAQDQLV